MKLGDRLFVQVIKTVGNALVFRLLFRDRGAARERENERQNKSSQFFSCSFSPLLSSLCEQGAVRVPYVHFFIACSSMNLYIYSQDFRG